MILTGTCCLLLSQAFELCRLLQKVMAWGGSAQVGLRESGNPASRAMCNVALLMLTGKNSHAAQVRGKNRVGRSAGNAKAYTLRSGSTFCIGTCQAVHRREPGHLMHGFLL